MRRTSLAAAAVAATLAVSQAPAGATPAWTPPEASWIRNYAIEQGHAVDIQGELIPAALDLYDWGRLADCESGGRWHLASWPHRGGLQFLPSTWRAVGGEGDPADASIEEQIERARMVLDRQGPRAWPGCSRRIGWR